MKRESSQEVLIIGAGVIGLAIARELHRQGIRKITIADRGKVGRESTFAAAGMLAVQAETDQAGPFFDLCRSSRDAYPRFAAELADETGIDIELDRAGTLYLALTESDAREIGERFEWQTRAGLAVEKLSAVETRRLEPHVSPDVCESLLFPDDWQVENRKLTAALVRYAAMNGLTVLEETECQRLLVENESVIGAETPIRKIYAQRTILAAGAWTSLIDGNGIKIPGVRPVRGQIVGFRNAKRIFSRVIFSPRGYVVPRSDGRILAGATVEDAGFENTVTQAGIDTVCRNAFEISPAMSRFAIAERCSGLRPKSNDGLPIIGGFPHVENLFVATGHFRNGILLAPITAALVSELLISNSTPDLLREFGPERFDSAGLGEYPSIG